MLKPLGRQLVRLRGVRRAVLERADLGAFRERPTPRLILGVSLILLSSLMGWPAVVVAGWLAVAYEDAILFFLGGPVVYGLSWVVWGLGILIAGRDAVRYGHIFVRWWLRRVAEGLLGGRSAALGYIATRWPAAEEGAAQTDAGSATEEP